ncbi:MAG: glycosyl transferase family 36, partial [Candidatus Omnitrophica bacterium]|nr:glycosyl transferase family 36 [Candidatus Omnitrophota bacterium]
MLKDKEVLTPNSADTQIAKDKNFETEYGYFSNDGTEFIITTPFTPRPWINVISNGDYSLVVSQAGGGYSWRGNSNLARITTWVQDLVRDNYGKFIYIRDNLDGSYWSLGYKPVCAPYAFYEARHGIGYSIITNITRGINAQIKFFVPREEPLEVWHITIKNESIISRSLSLFTYLEWCLGNGLDTHREFQKTFIYTEYNEELGYIHAKKRLQLVPRFVSTGLIEIPCEGFHSSSIRPSSYEADKEAFLGNLRDLHSPRAVSEGRLTRLIGKWNDSIASLKIDLELTPGEEREIVFTLGESKDKKEIEKLVRKYKDPKNAKAEFNEVKKFWHNLFSGLVIETPDKHLDFSVNTWLKYQAISGRIWARAAYFQQSGAYGFRDQLQDSQVLLPLKSELTKKQILLHACHQFKDGSALHWWHPVIELGPKTNMTDDFLWLVYLTLNYLEETLDFPILDEKVRFMDGPKKSLYVHCIKAIDLVLSRFSKRGLPLIGEGDWNDGLSNVGPKWKGESVWLGHFLYYILIEFSKLCELMEKDDLAKSYLERASLLKKSLNKYAWDGSYFIRATKDDGTP